MTAGRKKLKGNGSIVAGFWTSSFVSAFCPGVAPALAQSPRTFSHTGSMTITGSAYAATLLPNGKVLIAGGNTASAELYAPPHWDLHSYKRHDGGPQVPFSYAAPERESLDRWWRPLFPYQRRGVRPFNGNLSPTGAMQFRSALIISGGRATKSPSRCSDSGDQR